MKNKMINRYILSLVCLLTFGMTSCEDFLTVLPTNSITEENFFTEKSDLDNVRAAAYAKMASADVVSRVLYRGEVRSDNFELNKLSNTDIMYLKQGILQPTNSMFDWATFYTGINYCNKVLEKGQYMVDNNVDPSFNANDWATLKAEVLGLRAMFYFYLIKAYRNIPYVATPISTDAEAMAAIVAATPGEVILGDLIQELEEYKDLAPINYGNVIDNKGRFTRRSLRALLADMYLWRGCMLNNNAGKVNSGMSVSIGDSPESCFDKAIEHTTYLINDLMVDYRKLQDQNENSMGISNQEYDTDYPLVSYVLGSEYVTDMVYQTIWGMGNSIESIFDIQYDGNNTHNTAIATYFSSYSGEEISAQALKVNQSLFTDAIAGAVDVQKGFGKTDLRLLETAAFKKDELVYPYHKNIATMIIIQNPEDMTEGFASTPTYRQSDKNNMCQPIYHLSDIMLIKAEAIARRNAEGSLAEGFKLVNRLFKRYNPKAKAETGNLYSARLADNYAEGKSAENLLTLVYQERQREFIGEGKRWFDLVREAEYRNSTEASINMLGGSSVLQTRLRQLWAMYVPIYREELKVNYQLVQNPVWDKYTEK